MMINAPRSGGAHLFMKRWCGFHCKLSLYLWKTSALPQWGDNEYSYLGELEIQRPNGPTAQRRPEVFEGRPNAQAKQGAMESCAFMMERM